MGVFTEVPNESGPPTRTSLSACGGLIVASLIALQGCAVHYYDAKTGAEHLWGVGHLTMKAVAPSEGHQAVVRGTGLIGLSIGMADDGAYLDLGWESRRRVEIIDQNVAIRLEWPNSNFMSVRVGSAWPYAPRDSAGNEKEVDQ